VKACVNELTGWKTAMAVHTELELQLKATMRIDTLAGNYSLRPDTPLSHQELRHSP
jgi:hypothetical protein